MSLRVYAEAKNTQFALPALAGFFPAKFHQKQSPSLLLKRRSNKVYEPLRLRGGEEYAVCSDDEED